MVKRFTGSGRPREGGLAGTHRRDFRAHTEGEDWRHGAVDIDMEPRLTVFNNIFNFKTVQGTLEKITEFLEKCGQGFITVGDGYDTTDAAMFNNFNVGDPITPTIEDAFAAAFSHPRLSNGGIILLKAGTYRIRSTVDWPAGISLMGEIGGTTIVGEMSEAPMFNISFSSTRPIVRIGGTTSNEAIDSTRFYNLTLADNLDGYITSSGDPIPTMTTVPMIRLERGSSFEADHVTFLGRLGTLGAGPVFGATHTLSAFEYIAGSPQPTRLSCESCVFDAMKIGIHFNVTGSTDVLTVNRCRSRTFGTELNGPVVPEDNCFIAVLGGNATITDNFHIGGGLVARNFVVTTGTVQQLVMTGNAGGPPNEPGAPFPSAIIAGGQFYQDAGSADNIVAVQTGNSWGGNTQNNQWFLTVGDGSASVGDVTGTGAIDRVMNFASAQRLETTVVVNQGTYTVNGTSNNFSNLKLIGNKQGRTYPVLSLDVSSVSTFLGNRFVVFNEAQGIQFETSGASIQTVQFLQSNPPAISASTGHNVIVDDCIFINTTCAFQAMTAPKQDDAGNAAKFSVTLKNSHFLQDGTFADDLSAILPPADIVNVENCYFRGNGYALAIGEFGAYSNAGVEESKVIIRNCTMDLTSSTITASSPISDRYIIIDSEDIDLTMENCRVFTDNALSSLTTPIGGGLATTFTSFVDLEAKNITIDNCIFNGPQQTFTVAANTFAMPALLAEPHQSLKITNSRFIGGALPLQVSGSSIDTTANFIMDGVAIDGCEFSSFDSSGTVCLMDLDLPSWGNSIGGRAPKLKVTSCTFDSVTGDDVLVVQHAVNDSANADYYVTLGGVQIFANGWQTHFVNNNMDAFIIDNNLTFSDPYENITGVLVDGYHDSGSASEVGEESSELIFSNNIIHCTEDINFNAATIGSTVHIIAPTFVITDNIIRTTVGSGGANALGGLFIEQLINGDNNRSHGIISNNLFDRSGSLRTGWILVNAESGPSHFTDNIFSSDTIDGSSAALIVGAPSTWVNERNRNQIVSEDLSAVSAQVSISEPSGDFISIGDTDTFNGLGVNTVASIITGLPLAEFIDNIGADGYSFLVDFPLETLLPKNVEIIDASVTAAETSASLYTTLGTFSLILFSDNDSDNDALDFTAVTSGTATATAADPSDYITGRGDKVTLRIVFTESTAAPRTLEINLASVTYRYL